MATELRMVPPRVTWQEARPPFLVIRIGPGVYSIQLMPTELDRRTLVEHGWAVMDALGRRHQVCVAFGWFDAAYLEPDGSVSWSARLPAGGLQVDPHPSLLEFLPVVVDPGLPVHSDPVYWPEDWNWVDRIQMETEALRAPWVLGLH